MSFKDDEDLYPHVKLMYPNQGKLGNREDVMFNYFANGKATVTLILPHIGRT